jgi:sugar phosphate isomerase/epimerase
MIGAQTIVWGEGITHRMPEILAYLARTGYKAVETGLRHLDPGRASHYRSLYKDSGILPLGIHVGGKFWDPEQSKAELSAMDRALAFAAETGFRWVVTSGNPTETADSMSIAAPVYEAFGRRCAAAGLGFAYHNHDWELRGNAAILDNLLSATTPGHVSWVMDVAWATRAGADLDQLFSRYAQRLAYLHIKDLRGDSFCELGTGTIDHRQVLRLARSANIAWLVVEQDTTTLGPEESMNVNMDYLKRIGAA